MSVITNANADDYQSARMNVEYRLDKLESGHTSINTILAEHTNSIARISNNTQDLVFFVQKITTYFGKGKKFIIALVATTAAIGTTCASLIAMWHLYAILFFQAKP